MMKDIQVYVYCLAYNHEKYIGDALEGFIKQKTTFDFIVIVHDDASTDNTAKIILDYSKKYPDIFLPIFQKENQYSKGVNIRQDIILPYIQGKYIAICEGDDCWIDESKLQKQYDELEKHPECDMCAHNAYIYDCKKNIIKKEFSPLNEYRVLNAEEVIYGEGSYLPTCSLFFRKEVFINKMMFQKYWDIDYTIQIRGALRGGIVYLPDKMSIYRWEVPGSWTVMNKSIERQMELHKKRQKMLDILNNDTNGIYNHVIERRKKRNEFDMLLKQEKNKIALNDSYKEFFDELEKIDKIKITLKAYFPIMGKIYKRIFKKCNL